MGVSKDSFTNKVTLTKEEFCKIIRTMEKYREDEDLLSNAIFSIGGGYFTFESAYQMMYVIINLLGKIMGSPETEERGDDIDYYMFEECKKVWIDEKEYDISTPEKLYDFLTLGTCGDKNDWRREVTGVKRIWLS